MRRLLLLLSLIAPLGCHAGDAPFDFYALTLSWSPEHCANRPQAQQCDRGYGFVLHGLWPQFERGYPADCGNERWDPAMARRFPDLYPSPHLYRHEWRKHGTCSGLSQLAYHKLADTLRRRLVLPEPYQSPPQPLRRSPDQLRTELLAANPWLLPESITLSCSVGGRFLKEIYLCLTPDGAHPRACSIEMRQREQRLCAQGSFLMRSVR